MAKFAGKVGFTGPQTEVSPGVFEDNIVEKTYYGDVVRNNLKFNDSDRVLTGLSVDNSISILADAYASENVSAIRYVEWLGTRWTVSNVEVLRPRLILRLGGVYNGPSASAP